MRTITWIVLIVTAALFGASAAGCKGSGSDLPDELLDGPVPVELDGGRHEYSGEGYSDTIVSGEIVSFMYENGDFTVECALEDGVLHVRSRGGDYSARDGSAFDLDYTSEDVTFLDRLQELVAERELSQNNGYSVHVDGLPAGLGDCLSVLYASEEKLYKYSNEERILSDEDAEAIYDAFRDFAEANGLDFTTEGSNVTVYDDADEDYLQGTWKGTHFGTEYTAVFEGSHVKIFAGDELTDDTEYVVFQGSVRPNRLVSGVTAPNRPNDYEEFEGLSCFAKNNSFTLTAYFMKGSYSTCDLLRQNGQN